MVGSGGKLLGWPPVAMVGRRSPSWPGVGRLASRPAANERAACGWRRPMVAGLLLWITFCCAPKTFCGSFETSWWYLLAVGFRYPAVAVLPTAFGCGLDSISQPTATWYIRFTWIIR